MRYQEKLYLQNNNSGLRNRDNLNVNMSSDMCIFSTPIFSLSGANKINCTATTNTTYIISTATTIPFDFNFTGNTDTLINSMPSFKYEIYKFNDIIDEFLNTPVYQSPVITYDTFSGSNSIHQNIPVSGLSIDGQYLVKGYYEFDVCTLFLNKLGKKVDTLSYKNGDKYGLYDNTLDYFFIALKEPDVPKFLNNGSNNLASNSLKQQIVTLDNMKTNIDSNGFSLGKSNNSFNLNASYVGNFVVTLNGLALTPIADYTFTGNVVTMNENVIADDLITVIYTTAGATALNTDNLTISAPILSGATDTQGDNQYFFNTSTGKYELFTSVSPNAGDDIIVMINGVILANNVDYYQSISNSSRIILEGELVNEDLVIIAYFPNAGVINGIVSTNPVVSWTIITPPDKNNGDFTLQVSNNKTFNPIVFSSTTNYIIGSTAYGDTLGVSGSVGTKLYYRVKNTKNYTTLCGDIVTADAYSEIIPITIQSNFINSY